ncbi:hypothetical protein, partial [Klebsiella pneumoniae]|uniref:preprotein translocase subunit SecA n=1 Tax=Klebsiella pneumoniae TaxID=573 RepID=UPI00273100D2
KVNKIIPHLIRQEKEDADTFTGEGHFSVDEKARQVNLTDRGLVLIEELLVQEGIMDEGAADKDVVKVFTKRISKKFNMMLET